MVRDYSFNVFLAIQVGVESAVILHSLAFWIEKNMHNEQMFHDGRYWTYHSQKAMLKTFPFFSEYQLKRRIAWLIENDYIYATKEYSEDRKTYWYALTDKVLDVYQNKRVTIEKKPHTASKGKKLRPEDVVDIISYLNKRTGRSLDTAKVNAVYAELINARLNEGYSVEQMKAVIDLKTKEWLNQPKMKKYLRPQTLFSRRNFATYVDEIPTIKKPNSKVDTIKRKLNIEFGSKGIRNKESDRLARELIKLGYKNKDFLNMYLL